jgi:hypothetical protein
MLLAEEFVGGVVRKTFFAKPSIWLFYPFGSEELLYA